MSKAPTPTDSVSRLASILTRLGVIVLTIYLAYLVAHLFWFSLDDQSAEHIALPQQSATSSGNTNSKPQRNLAGYQLFGRQGAVKKVEKKEVKEAPKTSLRLVLKGVFTGDQSSDSGAIIEEMGRKSDYYRVGDSVPGNAILEEVLDDRVLLRRNGRLETLAFEDKLKSGSSIAKVEQPKPKARPDRGQVNTPEDFLEVATERLAKDPENALRSVGLSSNEGGGYVYQGKNPLLSGMNLKKGDVIMSVNGHTLGDVQKDRALMKSLYEQGSLEVEVIRDGASFYINYPLR